MRPLRQAIAAIALAGAFFHQLPAFAQQTSEIIQARELERRIRDGDGDPRLGMWQVELGEQRLQSIQRDLSDLTTLLGELTDEQRMRVLAAAEQAERLATTAEITLAEGVARLESKPDFGEDRTDLDLRSELNVEYAEFRRPLLHARASLLVAAAGLAQERQTRALAARELLLRMEPPPGALGAERLILLGHAGRLGGRPSDDRSVGVYLQAVARLESAPGARRLRSEAFLALVLELARMSRSQEMEEVESRLRGAAPFVDATGVPSPLWQLLLVDVRFRAALLRGDHPTAALRIYEDALGDESLGLDEAQRRTAIFGRLRALERQPGFSPSQPLIALAVATHTIESAARDGDVRALKRSIDLLEPMVTSGALGGAQPEAMSTLLAAHKARLDAESDLDGRALASADLLVCASRLAIRFPEWSHADDTLAIACALGVRLDALDRGVLSIGTQERITDAMPMWDRALRTAIERADDPEQADAWRIALARRLGPTNPESDQLLLSVVDASSFAAEAMQTLVRFSLLRMRSAPAQEQSVLARVVIERVTMARAAHVGSPVASSDGALLSLDLHELEASVLLRAHARTAELVEGVARGDLDPRVVPRAVALLRLALDASTSDLADAMRDAHGARAGEIAIAQAQLSRSGLELCERAGCPDDLEFDLGVALATGHILAGRAAQAIPILEEIMRVRGRTPSLLILLADALVADDDLRRAFSLYREGVEPLELSLTYDDRFWRAWAGMLEILESQNEDGSRSETIDREIRRLSSIDSEFGGEPHRRRVESVRRARR